MARKKDETPTWFLYEKEADCLYSFFTEKKARAWAKKGLSENENKIYLMLHASQVVSFQAKTETKVVQSSRKATVDDIDETVDNYKRFW